MEALYDKDLLWLWTIALAAALFIPVRQLIWVLYVRRAIGRARRDGDTRKRAGIDEAERRRLKVRAGFTAALLCFVFAFLYTRHLFGQAP